MYKVHKGFEGFDMHKPYFRGVALGMILAGAAVIALGIVELAANLYYDTAFFIPSLKLTGGLIVTALGYILLELELIRIK